MIRYWILSFFMGLSLMPAIAAEGDRPIGGDDNVPMMRNCRIGRIPAKMAASRVKSLSTANRSSVSYERDLSVYQGMRHQLVVMAQFADRTFQDADPLPYWNRIFNEKDFKDGAYKGSVHDYFYDQSYGQLDLIFDLFFVQLPSNAIKYASNSVNDENSQFLVYDIIDDLEQRSIDWSLYDWNSDGYIEQILIVYAGPGMNDGGGTNSIWPHQWWLSCHTDPDTQQPSETRIVNGVDSKQYVVDCYCAVQEQGRSVSSFGTICHEYSHCFGLPDFYSGSKMYVAYWDVMDAGNYNSGGYLPCGYSAQERMYMGWLTPIELNEPSCQSDIPSLSDQPVAYLVRNDGCENEYYIIENRQKKGWDANLPGSGLLIFHINFDLEEWLSTETSPNHPKSTYGDQKHYYIIPANNNTSTAYGALGNWPYPYNENDQLTNTTTPSSVLLNANSDGTLLMNKPITEMSVIDGLGSFSFMYGTSAVDDATMRSVAPVVLYELGRLKIVRCQDGNVKKIMTKQ